MTDAELFMKMRASFKEAEAFVEAVADRFEAQAAEIERLEAKLALAVEALETIRYQGVGDESIYTARITLAELTGGKP